MYDAAAAAAAAATVFVGDVIKILCGIFWISLLRASPFCYGLKLKKVDATVII